MIKDSNWFKVGLIILIYGVGLGLGFLIQNGNNKRYERVSTSYKARTATEFADALKQNDTYFIAEGKVTVLDPVSIDDIPGKFSHIEKVTETWERQRREVTKTDEQGNTTTETEYYWDWEVQNRENWDSKSVTFLGRNFGIREIPGVRFPSGQSRTITKGGDGFFKHEDVRYVYYTRGIETSGRLTGYIKNHTFDKMSFHQGGTINEELTSAEKGAENCMKWFWGVWTALLFIIAAWVFSALYEDGSEFSYNN